MRKVVYDMWIDDILEELHGKTFTKDEADKLIASIRANTEGDFDQQRTWSERQLLVLIHEEVQRIIIQRP